MKDGIDELSLVVIGFIGAAGIMAFTLPLLNQGKVLIEEKYNEIVSGNSEINRDNYNIDSVNVDNDSSYELDTVSSDSISVKLDKNILDKNESKDISIGESKVLELKAVSSKTIKQIKTDKSTCVNSCGNLNKVTDYSYLKTNSGYVVNVKDKANNNYSIFYSKDKNILGREVYKTDKVYNDTSSVKTATKNTNSLKEKEENKSKFTVNYDYNDSYISKAEFKTAEIFKDNEQLTEKIYNDNLSNIVMLNAYQDNTIRSTATGFLISKGIIATSWSFIRQSIKDISDITALSSNDTSYNVLGVVTVNEDADLALLKIDQEIDSQIEFDNINVGEEVLLLGTFSGFGISGGVGKNISNEKIQTNSLFVTDKNLGSPLLNTKGKVIGMVINQSVNNSLSASISSSILQEYKDFYDNVDYKDINYYDISMIKNKFYNYSITNEKKIDISNDKRFRKYKNLFDLGEYANVDLVLYSNTLDNIISLRYRNDTNIENDILITSFIKNLKKNNYKEILNSNKKKEFHGEYIVKIYYEFNYIILEIKDV